MQLLDATIVNVALPSIAVDLDATVSMQLLTVTVYTLAFACSLITAARVGDILGRRVVFLGALTVFVLASVACGLAQTDTALVGSRAVQGLAAGSMSAQTFALIAGSFPKRAHPKVFGIYGATMGMATVCGPLAGGLLIDWDLAGLGWRLVFLVNLPIGLAALVVGWLFLVDAKPPGRRRLDPIGAVASAVGLFLLVFPLAEGRERGWPAPLVVMLCAAVPVLVGFVVYEWWLGRRGGDPVVDVRLFLDRAFSRGALLAFAFFGTLTSLVFTISLTLQFGFGFSPLRAGLTTLPWAVGTGAAAVVSALVYRRIGNLVLPLGMGLFAGSLVLLSALLQHEGTDPRWLVLAGPLLVGGAGMGLFVAPLQSAILASVRPANAGSVSGLLPTVQQVGSSIGLAVIGVVFFNLVAGQAPTAVDEQRPGLVAQLRADGVPEPYLTRAADTFVDCAREQLGSSSPMRVPEHCTRTPGGDGTLDPNTQRMADGAVAAATQSTRAAAGEAFLQAERRVLWTIGGVAVVVGALSLTLPRRNRLVGDEESDAVDPGAQEWMDDPERVTTGSVTTGPVTTTGQPTTGR
ncbi:MFS transporter [Rhodococcus sp. HNM0569]|nr:MFS transporter [Rhodococcus sp. HNM0569]